MNTEIFAINVLREIEKKFKAKYESYKILKGYTYTAKAWKRAWLDIRKEIKKIDDR